MNRLDLVPLRVPGDTPRVCIISAWNEYYAPLAEIAKPNWKAYAERHGYALRFYPGEFHLDRARPQTYGDKVKHSLYYDVAGHCDVVMWLDIDSLFMNLDIPISSAIQNMPFVWTYDDNGPLSGLWVARTDATTEKHLRRAYEMAATENNVRHGRIEPNGISDQEALTRLMNVPPFHRTFLNCRPADVIGHCFPDTYQDGKWIVTFPGCSRDEKVRLMREWSARLA